MRETASFRADPAALRQIRQFVRERASRTSWPSRGVDELVQAVSEACANSMLHSQSNEVRITWKRRPNAVEVRVTDEGVFRREPELSTGHLGGHGISIMRALVDEVDIHEGTAEEPGTVVRLVKKEPTKVDAGQ